MATYITAIEVDHEGFDTPQQCADAIVQWIKEETGPISVYVTNVDTGKVDIVKIQKE